MPYSRTRELPESRGPYRELRHRMFVMVVLPVLLIRDMRMRVSKTIQHLNIFQRRQYAMCTRRVKTVAPLSDRLDCLQRQTGMHLH
jgi:hypothetical protein